ncbi:MAG TPA: DUF4349 domain-containing protein [Candidatus Acidoferrum sp.]|nr:DUF4349 domain-containing protein [Candidatus Acidoferrum sp.]
MRNAIVSLLAKYRSLSPVRRGLIVVLAIFAGLLIFARISPQPMDKKGQAIASIPDTEMTTPELQTEASHAREELKESTRVMPMPRAPMDYGGFPNGKVAVMTPPVEPLIAHTAELAVATKEFAKSRSSLEEILDRHRGYVAKLRMVGKPTGSTLSATLRIPSSEYGATLSELKTLGQVEREEEAADEVTQQRADLEARLTNAQGTLHHLQELLKRQTYPDRNVMELQRQIASVNADINRLEADRLTAEHRVVFANVLFALREEITPPTESLGAQLRNAAATGFSDAVLSLSALLMLLISRGPVFLLWIAILYLPARFAWRRWRHSAVQGETPVQIV